MKSVAESKERKLTIIMQRREKNIRKTLNKIKLPSNKIKFEIEKEKGIDKEIIYIKKEE